LPGASVGPLAAAAYMVQYTRLRDGDRFWYENDAAFDADEVEKLRRTRLSDVIRCNSGVTNLQANVFFVPEPGGVGMVCLAIGCVGGLRLNRKRVCAQAGGVETRPPRVASALWLDSFKSRRFVGFFA